MSPTVVSFTIGSQWHWLFVVFKCFFCHFSPQHILNNMFQTNMDHFFKTNIGYLVIVYRLLAIENRCLVLTTPDKFSHLHCISFADLVSLLCIVSTLSSCRWTHLLFRSRSPAWFIEWIVELVISIVLTLMVFNHLWAPFIGWTITWMIVVGTHLEHWNQCLTSSILARVAQWIRCNSTILMPILGSIWTFYVMLRLTGQFLYLKIGAEMVGNALAVSGEHLVELVWPSEMVNQESTAECFDLEHGRPKQKSRSRSRARRCWKFRQFYFVWKYLHKSIDMFVLSYSIKFNKK